jgi:hypothetical protein
MIVAYVTGVNGISLIGLIACPPLIVFSHYAEKGAKNDKNWARNAAFVFGVMLLFVYPFGTFFGFILLINCYTWKEEYEHSKQSI